MLAVAVGRAARLIVIACLAASCARDQVKEARPMTDMDPTSPEAWRQAEALAATVASGDDLQVRSKALPFLFTAGPSRAVLVHDGVVVAERGAAAAGRYMRDLGVVQGKGPGIDDVLVVLGALEAWPPIDGAHGTGYVHEPGQQRLADVTARIEHDGESARVVLHYFLSAGQRHEQRHEPRRPTDQEYKDNDVGSVDPSWRPPVTRKIARATLLIPASGEPAWRPIENLNWADPAP